MSGHEFQSAYSAETEKHALWKLCERFIRENNITCAEAVYQTDRVIENADEFIERICAIVGYHTEEGT